MAVTTSATSRPINHRKESVSSSSLDPPSDTRVSRWAPRSLLTLPIVFKVLIANALVVAFGAIAGTWVTQETVSRSDDQRAVLLTVTSS